MPFKMNNDKHLWLHKLQREVLLSTFPYIYSCWWLSDKESACQCKRQQDQDLPWVKKIPWRYAFYCKFDHLQLYHRLACLFTEAMPGQVEGIKK